MPLSCFCIVLSEILITATVIVHDLDSLHFMLNISSVGRFNVLSPHVINDNVSKDQPPPHPTSLIRQTREYKIVE